MTADTITPFPSPSALARSPNSTSSCAARVAVAALSAGPGVVYPGVYPGCPI
jgi:hypothetical protein